jgi:hypothetical protein
MGVESYNVVVISAAKPSEIIEWLRGSGGFTVDEVYRESDSTFLRYEDSDHIIECSVSHRAPCHVSLRFALCHPPTIDAVFIGIASNIGLAFDAHCNIPGVDRDDLAGALLPDIATDRALWQRNFGTTFARLSCQGAMQRYVSK